MTQPFSICWLRRDLRLHDHAVLARALQGQGAIQPVFILDTDILAAFPDPHDRRVSFIVRTLAQVHAQLVTRGGGLLVLVGSATHIMPKLAQALGAAQVVCAEDFEPATIARDAAVASALGEGKLVQVLDHVIKAPYRVLKDDGTPFKVFTPYYKKWLSQLSPVDSAAYEVNDHGRYANYATNVRAARDAGLAVVDMAGGAPAMAQAAGYTYRDDDLWNVDDTQDRLTRFMNGKLAAYSTGRDALAEAGTSQLSPYLRFGLVSIRECLRAADAKGVGAKWVSELVWREFYMSILYHFPAVAHHEFVEKYRGALAWEYNEANFSAFCEGRTGYPVVDAAIRQLLEAGWMHNRARMIVASFLTKDLLTDWRLGEAFFARHLMDFELASNNGGWQWAASTGTDAAPYFRVFNPELQSRKFDPSGVYIRRYVPELRGLDDKTIHAPSAGLFAPKGYPAPIVDHKIQKNKAISMFKGLGATLP